jgi:hypothetical protein
MLHRVALVRTDVSEELSPSFIRVTRIGELWTTLAVTSNRRTHIPEDAILHSHRRENLRSYNIPLGSISTLCLPSCDRVKSASAHGGIFTGTQYVPVVTLGLRRLPFPNTSPGFMALHDFSVFRSNIEAASGDQLPSLLPPLKCYTTNLAAPTPRLAALCKN